MVLLNCLTKIETPSGSLQSQRIKQIFQILLDINNSNGTGEDNFKEVANAVQKNNTQWENLKCVTTDDGKNICQKKRPCSRIKALVMENRN